MYQGGGPNRHTYAAVLLASGDLVMCYATAGRGPDLTRRYFSLVQDSGAQHLVDASWVFNPAQTDGQYIAIMQTDGNLVLYRGADPARLGAPYWASNTWQTSPTGNYCASLGPDGNLRVHNAAAATVQAAPAHPETVPAFWQTGLTYPAQRAGGGTCLHTNQWLTTGDYRISAHGQYAALLRGDGDLVLCGTTANTVQGQPPVPDLTRVYWSAFDQDPDHRYGAAATGSYFAVMQGDENFVVYNGAHPGRVAGRAPWAIRNYGEPQTDSVAVIRNDDTFAVLPGTDPNSTATPRYVSTARSMAQEQTRAAQQGDLRPRLRRPLPGRAVRRGRSLHRLHQQRPPRERPRPAGAGRRRHRQPGRLQRADPGAATASDPASALEPSVRPTAITAAPATASAAPAEPGPRGPGPRVRDQPELDPVPVGPVPRWRRRASSRLQDAAGNHKWESHYNGAPADWRGSGEMQTDGNLVAYAYYIYGGGAGTAKNPTWASGTQGNPGAYLQIDWQTYTAKVMSADGKTVLWHS